MSIDYDELGEAIQESIDGLQLEPGTAAYGIAQKVIHDGLQSLSPRQKMVYDRHVEPRVIDVYREWNADEIDSYR